MSNIRTRLSGIYDKPFFTPCSIGSADDVIDDIKINEEVMQDRLTDYDLEDYEDQEEMEQAAKDDISKAIFMLPTVWEVNVFDFDTTLALACNLIPFDLYDYGNDEIKHCLALGGCDMGLSPRLELYQFLQEGSMDKHSKLYSIINHNYTNDINYFEDVTYKGAIDEVKAILASNTEQAA